MHGLPKVALICWQLTLLCHSALRGLEQPHEGGGGRLEGSAWLERSPVQLCGAAFGGEPPQCNTKVQSVLTAGHGEADWTGSCTSHGEGQHVGL